jgi:hypothetical protein
MQARYRPITPDQRTAHIEALILLCRLVIALPATPVLHRTFFVMTAAAPRAPDAAGATRGSAPA